LEKLAHPPDNIFVTDVSDVTLINNPFTSALFKESPNTLFCGDEPSLLANEWMNAHSTSLRTQIDDFASFEELFAAKTLLNCGIIGGNYPIFYDFLQQLAAIHRRTREIWGRSTTWQEPNSTIGCGMDFRSIPSSKPTKKHATTAGFGINRIKYKPTQILKKQKNPIW
jgi:hypothetical protein